MNVHRRSRVIAPHVLNLDTRSMWVVNITVRLAYHGERTPVFIKQELGEPQISSWRFGEEKTLLMWPEIETRTVHPWVRVRLEARDYVFEQFQYPRRESTWPVADLRRWNPQCHPRVISFACPMKVEKRILDNILYVVGNRYIST